MKKETQVNLRCRNIYRSRRTSRGSKNLNLQSVRTNINMQSLMNIFRRNDKHFIHRQRIHHQNTQFNFYNEAKTKEDRIYPLLHTIHIVHSYFCTVFISILFIRHKHARFPSPCNVMEVKYTAKVQESANAHFQDQSLFAQINQHVIFKSDAMTIGASP